MHAQLHCCVIIYTECNESPTVASIPGRVFAFITVRRTTVIKAKTRPGIEASPTGADASVDT